MTIETLGKLFETSCILAVIGPIFVSLSTTK